MIVPIWGEGEVHCTGQAKKLGWKSEAIGVTIDAARGGRKQGAHLTPIQGNPGPRSNPKALSKQEVGVIICSVAANCVFSPQVPQPLPSWR